MTKQPRPKLSIVTASKNGARFLEDTINSIQNQRFSDFEHVVYDGASTDGTIEMLKNYDHIRWVSEPDSGPAEGWRNAFDMATGEYLMLCCISDGFLSRNWFQQCVDTLDNDSTISLVYGLPQYMTEDGSLKEIAFSNFLHTPPPQKEDFFPYWLATHFFYPEIAMCVRSEVFFKCWPDKRSPEFLSHEHPFLRFLFNFNQFGYLPYFIPTVASFGRIHQGSCNKGMADISVRGLKIYANEIRDYRKSLFSGNCDHSFKDANSIQLRKTNDKSIKKIKRCYYFFLIRKYLNNWAEKGKKAVMMLLNKMQSIICGNF